jgi:NADPH-dependent ferric siderophore reductase
MIDFSAHLEQLRSYKTQLEQAISTMESLSYSSFGQKRRGRPHKNLIAMPIVKRGRPKKVHIEGEKPPVKHVRRFTPAQRKAQAARMKAYWAAKKKAS